MKSLILLGGILGFGIGMFFSWSQENSWPTSLWHACAAAYATSMLMRWWGTAWRKNLAMALEEQRNMAAQPATPNLSNGIKS